MIFLLILFLLSAISLYGLFKSIRHEKEVARIERMLIKRVEAKSVYLEKNYCRMKRELAKL